MERKRNRIIAAVLLLLFVVSCGEEAPPLERIRTERMALVASAAFAGPLIYQRQDFEGPEAELARRIVAKMGPEIELIFAPRTFATLVPAVANGETHLAISALGVDEERRQKIDFSESYYTSELSLIINPVHAALDALSLSGVKIGVREGSSVEGFVRKNYGQSTVVPHNSLDQAVLALRRKEIDAVIDDRVMGAYALDTVTGAQRLEMLPEVLGTIPVAVGVPKNAPDLLALVNEVVAEVKQEGLFQTWLNEHLGNRLETVAQRHIDRLERERKESEPRSVTIRVSKDANYRIDIYKMANLTFQVRGGGKSYRSNRISFRGPVGVASVNVPPGKYTLSLREFGFNTPIEILSNHPKRVTVSIRLKADGVRVTAS